MNQIPQASDAMVSYLARPGSWPGISTALPNLFSLLLGVSGYFPNSILNPLLLGSFYQIYFPIRPVTGLTTQVKLSLFSNGNSSGMVDCLAGFLATACISYGSPLGFQFISRDHFCSEDTAVPQLNAEIQCF